PLPSPTHTLSLHDALPICDPARLDLHLVREVEIEEHLVPGPGANVAVAEQVDELTGVLLAGDEQHLAHPRPLEERERVEDHRPADRKSTRLNSSHSQISYA